MSASEPRVFVDTNILIYAFDRSSGPKHMSASELVSGLWRSRTACLSVQVLQEFYSAVSRRLPRARLNEVIDQVRDYSQWTVHRPDENDVLRAIDVHIRYQISFWDAMIVNSASSLGCKILWSEDLNHGQVIAGVEVRNPFVEASAA